jgi:protein-S-isoprenylcysteine O-methyltransferase Ste14
MTLIAAKWIWFAGVVGWFIIRLPHQRRSRRTQRRLRSDTVRELALLAISLTGMFIVPAIYCLTNEPNFAGYSFWPLAAWGGAATFAFALWLFYCTHRDLGRNWSVTLEIRQQHTLVVSGIYSRIRHPMYLAFWLWALAQALLLPNWIAGPAGLVCFGTLFFLRVGREERMMAEAFGGAYRAYMARTYRIIPGLY